MIGQSAVVTTLKYHECHDTIYKNEQTSYLAWGPASGVGFGVETIPGTGRVYTASYAAKVSPGNRAKGVPMVPRVCHGRAKARPTCKWLSHVSPLRPPAARPRRHGGGR